MPSACSNSWAIYGGITQLAHVVFARRTVVVSGGGSARTDFGALTRAAALANDRPVRKRRRLCRVCMDCSFAVQRWPKHEAPGASRGSARSALHLPPQLV